MTIDALTPSAAWDTYVGSQTPAEFMGDDTDADVSVYLSDADDMTEGLTEEQVNAVAWLLVRYIEQY